MVLFGQDVKEGEGIVGTGGSITKGAKQRQQYLAWILVWLGAGSRERKERD